MRKKSAFMAILLAAFVPVHPDQGAVFPMRPYGLGGHGGPHFKLTTLDGKTGVLGGGILGISTNPGFSWLAAVNYLEADVGGLEFGYGTLGSEVAYRYRKLIQPMAQFQLGWGVASKDGRSGAAYVAEGTGMLGFRLGAGEKIILGLGYREVEIRDVPGISGSALDGWNFSARLNYGIFDASPGSWVGEDIRPVVFSGFYSGKWTRLNGQWAWLDGGGTTVIFARRFAVGASGYRSRNTLKYGGQDFSLGYGGLLVRYLLRPMGTVHASVSLLSAMGGAGRVPPGSGSAVVGAVPVFDADAFLESNLTEFLRIGLGAGYRLVPQGFESLGPAELGGPTLTFQLATGAF